MIEILPVFVTIRITNAGIFFLVESMKLLRCYSLRRRLILFTVFFQKSSTPLLKFLKHKINSPDTTKE